jgi:hypothetical protein
MTHSKSHKLCRSCDELKPIGDFEMKFYRSTGRTYPESYCRPCNRDIRRIREEKKREDTAFRILQQRIGQTPCTGCLQRPSCAKTGWVCDRYKGYLETGKAA